ncbi:MAG: hypothetical protein JO040_07105 [Gemmatimonadetes bacterium]|nr:hypothetical protein [Gemmatimonadota bacterium]
MNYGRFDVEMTPLGRTRAHVRARGGAVSRLLDLAETRVLLACAVPRPLREHAEECVRVLPPGLVAALPASDGAGRDPGWETAAVTACLEGFVADGLLTAEAEVTEALLARLPHAAGAAAPPGITSLCIPTRDRPDALRRALESYLENGARHGRSPEVVVLDDSGSGGMRHRNLEVLREVAGRHGRAAFLATRERRERYARELAAHAGIPPEVARFALLGGPEFPSTYGATRNALLLDTVGELCLQVDADTVCAVSRPPESAAELLVTAEMDPNEYWFVGDLDEAVGLVREVDEDFLAVHERVLGRSPAGCIASGESGPLRVAAPWSPRLLSQLAAAEARVAVSFAGIVGDCGGPGRHHWRLGLRGASLERLTADPERFRSRLLSRQLVKCSTRTVVSTGAYCMAGNMGVDNRTLLPPFVPVGIAEDALFGGLRSALFPHLVSATVPYAIVHDPLPARPNPDRPLPMTLHASAVLGYLAGRFRETWPTQGGAGALRQLGAYFGELGALPEAAFAAYVRQAVIPSVAASVAQVESLLSRPADGPPHWRASLEENLAELSALVVREDPSSPSDLPGDAPRRRALFQLLLRRYGEVLAHWPEMVEAAAGLRRAGIRLAEAV